MKKIHYVRKEQILCGTVKRIYLRKTTNIFHVTCRKCHKAIGEKFNIDPKNYYTDTVADDYVSSL